MLDFPLFDGIRDLIQNGSIFVLYIFLAGLLMWSLIIERLWFFKRVLPGLVAQSLVEWMDRTDRHSWCARQIRQAKISRLNVAMTSGFAVMQVLVPMAPLLGLIGTVSGMLVVFSSMAVGGTADVHSMAAGVSAAMICTMSGLAVAISGLYPVHYLRTQAALQTERLADAFEL